MNNSIFRKQSIDKVSSPEQLNEYIHVVTPSSWIILSSIFIMLVGVIVWGICGTVETTIPGVAICKNGKITCYTNVENTNIPNVGMKITIGEQSGVINKVNDIPLKLDKTEQAYLLYKGGLTIDDFCYEVEADFENIPDGIYNAKITVNSVSPISFVLR